MKIFNVVLDTVSRLTRTFKLPPKETEAFLVDDV